MPELDAIFDTDLAVNVFVGGSLLALYLSAFVLRLLLDRDDLGERRRAWRGLSGSA